MLVMGAVVEARSSGTGMNFFTGGLGLSRAVVRVGVIKVCVGHWCM